MDIKSSVIMAMAICFVTACTSAYQAPPATTRYENPQDPGRVASIGIESKDIVQMTDQMMRDLLKNPILANRDRPPFVIVDATHFKNESSTRINKNLITNRLRTQLNRAANGRMLFVGRQYSKAVNEERNLKREKIVSQGTLPMTPTVAGADYRLVGTIASLEQINPAVGGSDKYHQITFEMVDLESGFIVWSNIYEMKKFAQTDILYR